SSAVLATIAAVRLSGTDLREDLAAGAKIGTVAIEESGASGDPLEAVRTIATPDGDGWRLDGMKPVVSDGAVADWVIVIARDASGELGSYLVTEVAAVAVPGLDPTRSLARLELSGTPA